VVYFEPAREYLSGGFEAAELLFPEVRRLFSFSPSPSAAKEGGDRAIGSTSTPPALTPGRSGCARHPLVIGMGVFSSRYGFAAASL
jgi:hypothetical protein